MVSGSLGDNRPIFSDYSKDKERAIIARDFSKLQTSKAIMDAINDGASLYDGKNYNIFKNEELRNGVLSEVGNSVTSIIAGEIADHYITGNILGGWAGAVASLSMDLIEIIANNLSNGAFDSMDALYESIFTMMMEDDAILLSSDCKFNDIDSKKQLTWMKLKSFYLARMNFATFAYGNDRDSFRNNQPGIAADCDDLLQMMSVLLYGIEGATQASLAETFDKAKECND